MAGLETAYDDGLDGVGVQVQNNVALQSVYSWKERRWHTGVVLEDQEEWDGSA